jgi:hypothetical protein
MADIQDFCIDVDDSPARDAGMVAWSESLSLLRSPQKIRTFALMSMARPPESLAWWRLERIAIASPFPTED